MIQPFPPQPLETILTAVLVALVLAGALGMALEIHYHD